MTAPKITKTLTFGLGKLHAGAPKGREIATLTETQQRAIYKQIILETYTYARLYNRFASERFAAIQLGEGKEYKPAYPEALAKMEAETALSSAALSQCKSEANAAFGGTHWKAIVKGEKSLPSRKPDGRTPIAVTNLGGIITTHNGTPHLHLQIFAKPWAKDNDLPNWIAFEIHTRKRTGLLTELQRMATGEWKTGSIQLQRNHRRRGEKWLCRISVTYTPESLKPLTQTNTIGIHLGIANPVAIHIRENGKPAKWTRLIGRGQDILNARREVQSAIKRTTRALKSKDSALVGSARQTARQKLRDLRHREKDIIKTINQRLAKTIADEARKNRCGTWLIGDLAGIHREDKPWIARNWSAQDLINRIEWNAKKLGATTHRVPQQYTSQRCPKCGHIQKENRKKHEFRCINCDHHDHADRNAARNISNKEVQTHITDFFAGNPAASEWLAKSKDKAST